MGYFRVETLGAVARLTLCRPDKHNAFDATLIEALTAALEDLDAEPSVRVVILAAEGKSFSAGADLAWMREAGAAEFDENFASAKALAALMARLAGLRKPTLALVQGAAFGGGLGLVACCDVAIASGSAKFCLSEVRLGLLPAAISPYVIAAIGARQARRYFQTAEVFDAQRAFEIGLVHEVCAPEDLSARGEAIVAALLAGAPQAMAAAKDLVTRVAGQPIDAALIEHTARSIAALRSRPEAREGLSAFLEKRLPDWGV